MRWKIVAALCLVGLLIACIFRCSYSHLVQHDKDFIEIPIRHLLFLGKPHIQVEIENKKYTLLIDSGANIDMSLFEEVLDRFQNKKYLGDSEFWGVNGKDYQSKDFLIPEATIEKRIILDHILVRTESEDLLKNGRHLSPITWETRVYDWLDRHLCDGGIGLNVLQKAVWFFDLKRLILCTALDVSAFTGNARYSLDGFVKVPMKMGERGAEILLETELGPKKFWIDTGANRSVLRGQRNEKAIRFWTGEQDLGVLGVYFFDLTDRLEVDGILGIDFFKKHLVCIDFPNEMIYIRPMEQKKLSIENQEKLTQKFGDDTISSSI
jgi:hypothetical protein